MGYFHCPPSEKEIPFSELANIAYVMDEVEANKREWVEHIARAIIESIYKAAGGR